MELVKYLVYFIGISMSLTVNIWDSNGMSLRNDCPHNCTCQTRTTLLCNLSQFQQVPFHLPNDTRILYLDQNNIQSIRPEAFVNLGNLTQLTLSNNHMNDSTMHPLSFKGVDSLDVLDLSYNGFTRIPKYIPANITSLYIISNAIYHLKNDAFAHMKYIGYLGLSYNQMCSIDSLAFNPLNNFLIDIDLWFNNLTCTSIDNGKVFSGLKATTILGLRFNPLGCIPDYLPGSLVGLDLVSINLTQVSYGPLNHLKKLTNVALWQNSITHIDDNAFNGLSAMTLLDINTNQINELNNNTLKGLKSMVQIYLYINAIEVISDGAFLEMTQLKELWLSGNKLTTLSPAFLKTLSLPLLDYVDISFNPFRCDCKIRWLKVYQEKNQRIQLQHLMTCAAPPRLKGKAWDVLSYKNFTC